MVDWMRDGEHEEWGTKPEETKCKRDVPETDSEEIRGLYARLNEVEERYEEIAEALGVVLRQPRKQHHEILSRARECKGAHDYFHRKPTMDPW